MSTAERYLVGFFGWTTAVLVLAWIAFQLQQQHFSPVVLFSLAVGGSLGFACLQIYSRVQRPGRTMAILLTSLGGLLLIVTEDYIGYRHRLVHFENEVARSHPLAAALTAQHDLRPTFSRHLVTRFQSQPLWWTLDLVLTVLSAGVVMAYGTRASRSETIGVSPLD